MRYKEYPDWKNIKDWRSTLRLYKRTEGDKWYKEYFVNQTEVFKWFEVISGQSVESITEILAIAEQWKDENDKSFCNIYEYAAG